MAFTRVQGVGSAWSGAPTSTTISVTLTAVGSGNAVLGIVAWDNTAVTLNTVTDDKGNNYNLETTIVNVADNEKYCAFSRTNITNAPTVITANFSASVGFRAMLADEFSGGSTASSDERDVHGGQYQATPGTATDAVTSGSFTTTVNGDLLYGVCGSQASVSTPAAGTSFTLAVSDSGDAIISSEYRTQATAGAGTAATFTESPAAGASVTYLIAIKPPAAAAGRTPYNPWPQAAPILAQ